MALEKIQKIAIIGAGNLATHLSLSFNNVGKDVIQIYSRTKDSAKQLAKKISSSYTNNLKDLTSDADIYIVSINDSVLEGFLKKIYLKDKLIVHTSGSTSMEVLKKTSSNYGVFYPLQTFSKDTALNFSSVTFCIEANNKRNTKLLVDLAKTLSKDVRLCIYEERKIIHLSAVFACNFTNFMYVIAKDILDEQNINFEILKPLITETAKKVINNNPINVQTGPAVRKDMKTIKKHLEMLANHPDYKEIYDLISRNIIKMKE